MFMYHFQESIIKNEANIGLVYEEVFEELYDYTHFRSHEY